MLNFLFKKRTPIKKYSVPSNSTTRTYDIPPNCTSSKKYEVTADETKFLDALMRKSEHLPGRFKFVRLSDGTINVSYGTYPVGKVKLQGKRTYLMYLKNIYDTVTLEDKVLWEYIDGIDFWLKYIKRYLTRDNYEMYL